jgi:hypothetical protein
LKCYNFLWVQRRHNCSPAASFATCIMTLCLLKVHLQTFLSIALTKKCQILSCDTLVANERYGSSFRTNISAPKKTAARSSETLDSMTSHIWRLWPSYSTSWKPQIYSSSVLYLCQWQNCWSSVLLISLVNNSSECWTGSMKTNKKQDLRTGHAADLSTILRVSQWNRKAAMTSCLSTCHQSTVHEVRW